MQACSDAYLRGIEAVSPTLTLTRVSLLAGAEEAMPDEYGRQPRPAQV